MNHEKNKQSSDLDFTGTASVSQEEAENEAVRRLAARLAPSLEKAAELLAVPDEFKATGETAASNLAEDDDMDQELQDLANAEDMLRRELEDIQAFSNLFHYPLAPQEEASIDTPPVKNSPQSPKTLEIPTTPKTLAGPVMEADLDGAEQDTAPEQKYVPRRSRQSTPSSPARSSRKSPSPSLLRMGSQPIPYHVEDHQEVLGVERNDECGWYTVDLTRHVVKTEHPNGHGLNEICMALPHSKIQPWFVGLQVSKSKKTPPLPVRTLTIRIRPDVLCGAVMDAVASSLRSAKVWKRQGGHLRALIRSQFDEVNAQMFVIDAQVVTFKTMECRRVLLIRVYHPDADFPDRDPEEEKDALALHEALPYADSPIADEALDPAASLHLREACALLERIEYPSSSNKALHRPAQSPSMSDRDTMSQSVRKHLLDHYKACPSVKMGEPTLPSLNPDDWPIVQAAWPWIYDLWSELENRELTYTTLTTTTAFGKFPSLSTLDVHYCSQIRRYSREAMVVQLLKSASDLEEWARKSEYACANMISLLTPTFEAYEVEPPPLPKPVPLTSYKLDFVPPQTECPPWGLKVMEALNHIQANSSSSKAGGNPMDNLFTGDLSAIGNQLDVETAKDSLRRAEEGVAKVFTAFQAQDDEEKGARLARKNIQVMDRLSKMENHRHQLVSLLSNSTSPQTQKAAEDLAAKTGVKEPPLLKWTVLVGSSTGTCWVTAKHIIFSTQLIPVIGSKTRHIFEWSKIQVSKSETPHSLLNPLSVTILLHGAESGATLFSFRPSVSGDRLYTFLKVMQETACSLERTL